MKNLIIVFVLILVCGCTTIQEGIGNPIVLSEQENKIPVYGISAAVVNNEVQNKIISNRENLDKYILLGEYVFQKENSMKDINGKKILTKTKKIAFEKDADGFMVTELYEKRMEIIPGLTGLGWHLKGYTINYGNAEIETLKRNSTLVTKGNQFKIISAYQAIVTMDYAIKNKIMGLYSIAGEGVTKYTDSIRNNDRPHINSICRSLVNRYIEYLSVMAPIYISKGQTKTVKTELSVLKAKESKTKAEIDLINYLSELLIRGS